MFFHAPCALLHAVPVIRTEGEAMPGLRVVLQDIKKIDTEALIVGFFADVRPLKGLAGELDWLLCGTLSRLILENKLKGSTGDMALVTSGGKVPAQKIFMVGLGPREALSASTMTAAARNAVSTALSAGVTDVALEYLPSPDMPYETAVAALRKGLNEGAGRRGINISLLASDAAMYEKILKFIQT